MRQTLPEKGRLKTKYSGFQTTFLSNRLRLGTNRTRSVGFAHDLLPKHPNPIISVYSWIEPTLRAAWFLISIMNRHSRAGGFAAYSEVLPQSAAVAFVLAEVAVNGTVMERDPVVFAQVGAYLFGAEFAADKGVDVLNQLRIKLIGFSPVLFGQPALPLGFIGAVLLSLDAVPLDFAADGAFVAVKLFGDFGNGAVAGQVLDMVSFVLGQLCVAHGNLSCRKGRMLPHTGLFLLWKVAFQMRIRRPFHIGLPMYPDLTAK